MSFDETTNAAGIKQPACTRCGDCCGGCNVGAKNTVALTYLPEAVRRGAHIFTETRVRSVARSDAGRWLVNATRLDGQGSSGADITLSAGAVVLAAGTLGSTEILLRSREHGLALSSRLGERFSANGDIIAFGYGAKVPVNAIGTGHPPRVELGNPVGASVSGQIEFRDPSDLTNELCVQEGVLPSALAPILPVMFVPNGRLVGAVQSLISGVYKGPFASLQTFFAVSHDTSAGRLALDGDRLSLSWPGAGNEPVYRRLDEILSKLVTSVGGTYVKNPLAGTVMGHQPATAHPLGGVAMAAERADGVVNHKGQVFDGGAGAASNAVHSGLYVLDGSVIPRSLGVNPLLTITALAERSLIHMAQNLGAQIANDAFRTAGLASDAGVAPMQDQPMMRVDGVLGRDHAQQLLLHLERRRAGREPGAVGNTEHVRIDRHCRGAERNVEHGVRRFSPHARQRLQQLPVARDLASMLGDQALRQGDDVPRLVAIETNGLDVLA